MEAGAARARRRESAAEVERVRPEFGRREVRAPFNGVITDRLVEPGTPVSAAQAWFRISEMDATEIEVETDENNLGKLKLGQPVVAFVPAYPDKPFRGTLTQVGPFVDSERGVVRLKITPEVFSRYRMHGEGAAGPPAGGDSDAAANG